MSKYTTEIIPYGYCHCGCGQKTSIETRTKKDSPKGQPRKFCLGHGVRRYSFSVRFWSKVNKDGSIPAHCPELGQCWEWIGFIGTNGYGRLGRGKENAVHRISYELQNGKIANNLWVLHKCDNSKCVNPNHLFLGTVQDNVDDMFRKGRNPDLVVKSQVIIS